MIKQNIPAIKNPETEGFIGEFYQAFTEELTSIPLKLFPKIAEKGKLSNRFCKVTITLIQKEKYIIKKRKLQVNITNEHRCKNPQ